MKESTRQLILNAYPSSKYGERDVALLDRQVSESEIRAIAEEIERLDGGEVQLRCSRDYDVCYDLTVDHPDAFAVSRLQRIGQVSDSSEISPEETAFMTIVKVSRLGRFYCKWWNSIFLAHGKPETKYEREAPIPGLEDFSQNIDLAFQKRGYVFLEPDEIEEAVPWIDPGDSLVDDKRVTVYNCLFSEL